MSYLEWNDTISSHFFNSENAGKNILLYATKQDIINLGKLNLISLSDEEIWTDFITAIKYDGQENEETKIPHSSIDKPLQLFENWNKQDTPPFIAFLILYTIPLTETYKVHFNATNYYGRVNLFFKKNKILNTFTETNIGTWNFQNISHLWNQLEEWSIITRNCDLGIFELKKFGNPNWIHVGKPLSQCVFTPRAIERLPDMFLEAGMVPDSYYADSEIKRYLLRYGASILNLTINTINLIRKSDSDELGHSIIEIAKREYNKWNGESNQVLTVGKAERLKKMLFPGRIYLQFKINSINGSIEFSYRTKFNQDYPENLKFGDLEIEYERNGFSQTLSLSHQEPFELVDELNKWIAKFPEKEVRLFYGAGNHQLSTDYWIETDVISRTDWMFLICKNEYAETISYWGKQNCEKFINESDLEHIPDGYSLFMFLNPIQSHNDIPLLTVNTVKSITLKGGLKKNFRVFLKDFLPEVEVVNAIGKEQVFLQYKNDNKEIPLMQKNENSNRWLLPDDIVPNFDFYIMVKDEEIEGYAQAYQICEPDCTTLSNDIINKRNIFDSETQSSEEYIQGNQITTSKNINTVVGGQSFLPNTKVEIIKNDNLVCTEDMLLKWLVVNKQYNLQSFSEAFEIIHNKTFEIETPNLHQKRQSTIYFLDYLGYVDYDYSKNKITTLPPKFILIPSQQGRKAMLVGGRDMGLVKKIINYCVKPENKVSITIKGHDNETSQLLIPDTILLESETEREFQKLSQVLNIEYDQWYLLKFKALVPTLKEYADYIVENNRYESQEDNDWARQVFDLNTFQFIHQDVLNKTYSLVEYTYTTYWKEYGLWIDNTYYKVDKSWGKYLVLNHYSEKERGFRRDVIYSRPREIYLNNDTLAIPASLPLPKIMSRILLQTSGDLPSFKQLTLKGKTRWYNVYHNLPSLFIDNFFRFKLYMNIERTTLTL